MKKSILLLTAFAGLTLAAVPFVGTKTAVETKAASDVVLADATAFEITAVSNHGLLGWGPGILVQPSVTISLGYPWQGDAQNFAGTSNKIHLYNASGTEVTMDYVEAFGNCIALERSKAANYNGYSLLFEAGWSFTNTSGVTYELSKSAKYKCEVADGELGAWTIQALTDDTTPVSFVAVGNSDSAGWGNSILLQPATGFGGKYVHEGSANVTSSATGKVTLKDANGNAATISSIEEFGDCLVINRGQATNYYGFTLEIAEGWSFTLSTGKTYKTSAATYAVCEVANGVVNSSWVLSKALFDAKGLARQFLGLVTCDGGATAPSVAAWNQCVAASATWDSEVMAVLASADENTDVNVSAAVARYDFICGKYNTASNKVYAEFIAGRTVVYSSSRLPIATAENNNMAAIVIVSLVGVTALAAYTLLKKKEN